jgi:hypothetical protein
MKLFIYTLLLSILPVVFGRSITEELTLTDIIQWGREKVDEGLVDPIKNRLEHVRMLTIEELQHTVLLVIGSLFFAVGVNLLMKEYRFQKYIKMNL